MSTTLTSPLREFLDTLPDMLTAQDVCDLLRVNRLTVLRWVRDGRLPRPVAPTLRCLRWPRVVVARWLEQLEQTAKGTRKPAGRRVRI
jgi:excisionase family DNA binding protein